MTTRLRNYINEDETERAKDDGLIKTKYKGTRLSRFTNKFGGAYYNFDKESWMFICEGQEHQVSGSEIDCVGKG